MDEQGGGEKVGGTDQQLCSRCGSEPRLDGNSWGKVCRAVQQKERRARQRASGNASPGPDASADAVNASADASAESEALTGVEVEACLLCPGKDATITTLTKRVTDLDAEVVLLRGQLTELQKDERLAPVADGRRPQRTPVRGGKAKEVPASTEGYVSPYSARIYDRMER